VKNHGMATRLCRSESGGSIKMGAGTLYTAIKRLLEQGYITEVAPEKGDDPRRRSYRISPKGLDALNGALQQYQSITQLAKSNGLLKMSGA
jgi:DNA-binding PadR family transcriptional regulator